MANKEISTFKIAAAYIGTVVGAGFASGQEVLQFFGYFGLWGLAGIVLATLLFIFFGRIILFMGRELRADSHLPVILKAGGPWIGWIIDFVITFFLFGALTAMAAGAGAVFEEQFGWPSILGNGLMILASMSTVLLGISGIITAISFVVPLLMVAVLGICVLTVLNIGFEPGVLFWNAAEKAPVPFWPLSAVVYVSYNLVIAVAVLAPLGKAIADPVRLSRGALWGGLGLGLGAAAIMLALLVNMPRAGNFDIPMIFVSGRVSPLAQTLYSVVLFAEIYTTAVASLYGFTVRITSPGSPRMKWLVLGVSLLAFTASQFGFTSLVRVLYPAVGFAGLLLLGALTYRIIKPRR